MTFDASFTLLSLLLTVKKSKTTHKGALAEEIGVRSRGNVLLL